MYVPLVCRLKFRSFITTGKKKPGTCSLWPVLLLGAALVVIFLTNPTPIDLNPALVTELEGYGINNPTTMLPPELFNWPQLFTLKGFIMIVFGGFLVGFGTRYAGGCTSGHAIMGLSNLQLPSLIATISFMAGGFIMANLILPFILQL